MKNKTVSSKLNNFVLNNWFKLILIGAAIYILFQKDMSFTINLNAPFQEENIDKKGNPQVKAKQEKEQYTADTKALAAKSKTLDKFEFPFFGKNKTKDTYYKELSKVSENHQLSYLRRFANVGISERKKFNIPSSIILANALLHSQAGQNSLAKSTNNQFGLINKENEYKEYHNAWASFRAHSEFITSGKFEPLKRIGSTDYKSWARGLEELDFSPEENLAEKLVELIEKFQLADLDRK